MITSATTIGNNSPGGLLNTDEAHLSNTIVAGNTGGPTQTMALLTGSPAIGRGDGVTCGASPVSDKDQRGDLRNSAGRSSCDIGAYDTGGVTTITVTPAGGWILLGGYPLTVWNDTVAVWSYSATNGSWTALSDASPPQPSGTGAWSPIPATGRSTFRPGCMHCCTREAGTC